MLYVQAVGEKGVKVVSTDSPKSKAFPFTALCELRKKGVRGIFKREDGKLFAVPMTPVKGGGVKYFGKKIAPSEYTGLVWKDTLSSVSQSRFKQYKGVYARGAERPNTFCADSVGVDGSWMPQVTNLAFGTIPCILVSENTGTKSHMLYPERVPSINSYLDAWVENNKVQLVNAHCEYDSELNMFKVPKELHDNFYITLPKSPLQLDGDERASKRLSYYSGNVIMEYTVEDLRRVGLDAKYILCSLDIDKRGNQGVLSCWVTDRGSTELVTLPDIVYDLRAMASQGETNARVRKYYPDIEIRGNTLVMTCMQGTFTFDIDALLQDNTNAMDMGSAGVSGLGKVLTTPVVAGVGTTSIPAGIGMPSVSLLSPDEVTVDGTVAVGVVVPVSLSRDGDTITASDGITYKINDRAGEAYVETADKSITVANILSEVDGYPVTWIDASAFRDCTSLTSVTIPNSVRSIDEGAFRDCTSLTTVTIPNSVTFICNWAFDECTSLTTVSIPDSVTEICYGAFYKTAYYNDETNWENGVLYIDNCLIDAKTSISGDYTIKDGTRLIAEGAFSECTSLTAVTIPDSVTSINSGAFRETAYYNDETNWENGVLYIDNCLIAAKDSVSGDYTIKDGTRLIADYVFWDCTSLATVTIPDSVTSIGRWAFAGCKSLTEVTIPDSVTSIGYYAFSDTSVKSIRGYRGTEAEKYANKNGFKFVVLDGGSSDTDDEIVYGIDEEKGVAYVKSAR